jgi:rhamnopyranosyl-N-acetylglucosaminyl-diphospho-decaprenol beta-1,3/1,4-galactofuranosyltransferase
MKMQTKKENQETVCAVVVTYNRKKLLLECLEALRKQTRPLQGIYIIDNASTDGTPELLLEKGYIKELPPKALKKPWEKEFEVKNFVDDKPIKIHYVRMTENTGGAGGFYEGVKRAYLKGYDWLWLMDDDCLVEINTLQEQLKYTKKNELSCPLKLSLLDKKNFAYKKFKISKTGLKNKKVQAEVLPFNGFLIYKKVIDKIGFPPKDFYIDRDDIYYSLKAKKAGFLLFYITNAKLYHPEDKCCELKMVLRSIMICNYGAGKKIYYKVRNSIFLFKEFGVKYVPLHKILLREFICLFCESNIKTRFFLFIKGIIDGFLNKKGKQI